MEFGMSRRIKPKEKYARISMKEIWRNLDDPLKNKEFWSYDLKFEFSYPKSSSQLLVFHLPLYKKKKNTFD